MPTLEKILSRSKSNTTKKQKEKKDKNTSKKKEILYKDNTSGITYYSGGSTSKIKKEAPKKEGNWWEGRRAKKDRAATKKGMAESKMKSTIAKAEKKYAAESMFKSAKARDDAKTTPGKARPFKTAFDDATSKGKDRFLWKGKSFLTTKGKRSERFPVTTDKKKAAPAGKEQRQILKRVKWMEKRKEAGKGYSAKNLAELTKKLEELNIR